MDLSVRSALQELAPAFAHIEKVTPLEGNRSRLVCIAEQIVVKQSKFAMAEAAAIRYVSQHTSVPVPNVYGTYTEGSCSYLVMDFVPGETLFSAWDGLSERERKSLAHELKGYLRQLRSLSETYIGAVEHKPFVGDILFDYCPQGPFSSGHDFHDYLAGLYRQEKPLSHFGSLWRKLLKDDHNIVFSHGDLNPNNIIIRNGHIACIIDWEMAGFFPEYWEYARACLGVRWSDAVYSDYILFVQACMQPFPSEAWALRILDSSWMRIN